MQASQLRDKLWAGTQPEVVRVHDLHPRARLGDLPNTVEVITGSRGRHIYLACANVTVRNSAGLLGSGIDVRGDGGYVVAPPSSHAQGEYAWEASSRPEEVALGLLPEAS